MDKKKFSTFSYKLVQISSIMILVNSGAFLSISSWFCELTELIFVMIPYISSTGYPPQNARDYGSCASSEIKNRRSQSFSLARALQRAGREILGTRLHSGSQLPRRIEHYCVIL